MSNKNEYSTNIPDDMHASLEEPCRLLSSWFVYNAELTANRQREGSVSNRWTKTKLNNNKKTNYTKCNVYNVSKSDP